MALPSLFRRERGREVPIRREVDPVAALRSEMNRLFEDFGRTAGLDWPAWAGEGWGVFQPSMDVEDREDEVRVTAELPGLEEKDFELFLDGESLTLRGEKKHETESREEGWFRSERVYGSFERRVPLPCEVESDAAKAGFRKGVLTVTLPKTEASRRRRVRIPILAS